MAMLIFGVTVSNQISAIYVRLGRESPFHYKVCPESRSLFSEQEKNFSRL